MAAITVGTTAAAITGWTHKQAIIVQNLGAAAIYYGRDSGVTTATGIKIEPGGNLAFDAPMERLGAVYLISGTSGQDVRWETVG